MPPASCSCLVVILFIGNHRDRPVGIKQCAAHANDALRRGRCDLTAYCAATRCSRCPAWSVIIASGVLAALQAGFLLLRTGWILWSIVLFGISGLAFGVRFTPLQRRMRDLAQAGAASGDFDRVAYERLSRQWDFWRGGYARADRRAADGAEAGFLERG